jgi:16S rRNA (guanine966-N2)-methyltransferase
MSRGGASRTGVRVIGGRYRGLRLATLPGLEVRPTADRVKEALFSMLAPRLPGARVVDCFAGTGALGIEALSRGAARVDFVERDPGSLALLRGNLEWLGEEAGARARVLAGDALQPRTWEGGLCPLDLVLADPPYRRGLGAALLAVLAAIGPWPEGALVVLEHESGGSPSHPAWVRTRERRYGDTALSFFARADHEAKGERDENGDLSGDL